MNYGITFQKMVILLTITLLPGVNYEPVTYDETFSHRLYLAACIG
jgi:hypothetical protein